MSAIAELLLIQMTMLDWDSFWTVTLTV